MPNYVTNIVSIAGSDEQKAKLFDQIAFEGHPGTFDFNKVIPMPPSLDLTEGTIKDSAIGAYLSAANPGNQSKFLPSEKFSLDAFADIFSDAKRVIRLHLPERRLSDAEIRELASRHEMESPEALINLGKQYLNNYREHGAATWYDWCVQNWGTKWNNAPDEPMVDEKDGLICFLTAWSAPTPIIEELSRQYPDLTLSISWADEDIGQNVGQIVYRNGECTYGYEPEPGSVEALELACDIQGIPLEEVIEDYLPDMDQSDLDKLMDEAKNRAQEKQCSRQSESHEPTKNNPER